MQSTTASVTSALTADETTVAVRVLVDWNRNGSYTDTYDDLSAYVDQHSLERAISSDIPDAGQVLTGRSDGSAEITLTGPEVVAIFSPYTSTLSSVARMGAPCQIDLAVTTSNGVEYVPMLRGRITRVGVDGDAGTVALQVIDQWESVTKAVSLPMVVADDRAAIRPRLNASWVMDWILRQNGFYCTPPVRSSCLLSATMHGSTAPEVGTMFGSAVNFRSGADQDKPRSAMTYSQGTLGPLAMNLQDSVAANLYTSTVYLAAGNITVDSGANLFVEGWWLVDAVDNNILLYAVMTATNGQTSSITLANTGTTMYADLTRSGSTTVTGTAGTVSPGWHYLALHAAFTPTGATINARVDGVTSTFTLTPVTGGGGIGQATGNGSTTGINLAGSCSVEGYQVTTEPFSAGMWNNAFARTAVLEPSLNELTATPTLDTGDSRDLLQSIAAAEAGIVTFDETGVFRFYNRNHLPQTTVSATMTTTRDLLSIGTTEAMDSVRNVVSVTARPLKVETTDSTVWALSETTSVPARGTVTIAAQFDNPVFVLRTSVAYYSAIPYASGSGYKLASGSGYRASSTADGTGTSLKNLVVDVTQTGPATARITIRNPNAVTAYLVNNNDQDPNDEVTQGADFLVLRGRAVVPATTSDTGDGTVVATVRNEASITVFREQVLDVPDSPWMQSTASANDLAGHLAYLMGVPRPVMDSVSVIANPALQLADRVHLTDAETGMQLDRDYGVAGYALSADGAGLTQTLDVRELLVPMFWDAAGTAGTWDYASWQ